MAEHAGAETRRCNLRLVVSGIRLQGICGALRRIDEGGHGVLMIGLTIEMEEDRLGANNAVGSSDLQPLTREAATGTSDVSLRRHRPMADGDRAAGGQEGGGVAARLGGGETWREQRSGLLVAMETLRPRGWYTALPSSDVGSDVSRWSRRLGAED